jgi:2-oxoglutarate ferredoxin oxidoreductase subunit alpha
MPMDHQKQLDKRRDKLSGLDPAGHWAEIRGSGDTCIITWGSSSGAVFEAGRRLEAQGNPVRVIAIRLLSPLPKKALRALLEDAERVLVVEQNHGGQLFHYLHSLDLLPETARVLAKPGPLPIRPGDILNRLS